jgi:hypothetical protein
LRGLVLVLEDHERSAPTAGFRRGIPEGKNFGVFLQNATHNIALHTNASSMNEPNLRKSGLPALPEIFFDDARNILGMKSVEIDGIFDGEYNGFSERW